MIKVLLCVATTLLPCLYITGIKKMTGIFSSRRIELFTSVALGEKVFAAIQLLSVIDIAMKKESSCNEE